MGQWHVKPNYSRSYKQKREVGKCCAFLSFFCGIPFIRAVSGETNVWKRFRKKYWSYRTVLVDMCKWNSESFATPATLVKLGFGRGGLFLVFVPGALLPLCFGFSYTSFLATCGTSLTLGLTSGFLSLFVTFSPLFALSFGFVMPPGFFSRVRELAFSQHDNGSIVLRGYICSPNRGEPYV